MKIALVEDHVKDGYWRQVLELGVVGLGENARMLAVERSCLLLLPAVSGLCRSLVAFVLHLLMILLVLIAFLQHQILEPFSQCKDFSHRRLN